MDKDSFDTINYIAALGSLYGLGQFGSHFVGDKGSATKPRRPVSNLPVAAAQNITVPIVPYTGTEFEDPGRRVDPAPMDRVVAGSYAVKQRSSTKRKLKSGKLGRKLQKLTDSVIVRWQRIYNYGQNTTAYPADITQASNAQSGGRLQLSHYSTGESPSQINLLPVYLWDLTCWKTENLDGTVPSEPRVCVRLGIDALNNPQFETVYTQYQTHSLVGNSSWQLERSNVEGSNGFPLRQERKAVLKWSDMRFCFYGARQHPTRIVIELIQFKEDKYSMNFHADGEQTGNMSIVDQQDVRGFWLSEVKKLVYHPLDVQNFKREKAISCLYRESFQIAPDDTTNLDECPPNVVKRIFKRFNRLVNWDWETPPITDDTGVEADKNELETPAFQVGKQTNLKDYANPNARIYLYIRAEDVDPVPSAQPLYTPATAAPTLFNDAQAAISSANWTVDAPPTVSIISQINNTATPTGTYVCGYDWKLDYEAGAGNSAYQAALLPRFCQNAAVPAVWSTATTPSFDIILRQCWALQQ